MAISFQCPHCQKAYRVKDELAGKRAPCTQCKSVMTVPRPTISAEELHAVEAMASAALVEESHHEASAVASSDLIKLECEYCFEAIEFPAEKAGKKAPCPSCRRIIQVPAQAPGSQKRQDWREVKDTLTMARKNTESAPEGAWGNAQLQQQVVSREALLEAKVVVDRKTLMAPDRTKLYITLAVLAAMLGVGGIYFFRGKAQDDRRLGLVADAIKGAQSLPAGWPAATLAACGEFYLHEDTPDLKLAKKNLQDARTAVRQVELPSDRAGLLSDIARVQAELVGDESKINEKRALSWDDAHTQLRQTLQLCKELPVEDGWLVLEDLTRKLGSIGQQRPLIVNLAPDALPTEADRQEALACVGLILQAGNDPAAKSIVESVIQGIDARSGEAAPVRTVALLIAAQQMPAAAKLLPEPKGEESSLAARMAYAEGFARAGDWDKAKQVAMVGTVEHRVCALAMIASAAADVKAVAQLEPVVAYTAEQGKKFTLPAWAVMRIARACERGGRADLAHKLADDVKLPSVAAWLQLAALQADLKAATASLDASNVKGDDKSPAQALAWTALARHNARVSSADPRQMINAWPNDHAKVAGAVGAALGLQDRRR